MNDESIPKIKGPDQKLSSAITVPCPNWAKQDYDFLAEDEAAAEYMRMVMLPELRRRAALKRQKSQAG